MKVYPVQIFILFFVLWWVLFLFSSLVMGVLVLTGAACVLWHTSPHPSGAQTLGREMKFGPLNEELLCFYSFFFSFFLMKYLLLSWGRAKQEGVVAKKWYDDDVCVVLLDWDECFLFEFTTKCGEKNNNESFGENFCLSSFWLLFLLCACSHHDVHLLWVFYSHLRVSGWPWGE